MTNSEYLNALIPEVPQAIKDAVMAARGVNPSAVFTVEASIELAEADLYRRIMLMPDFKEGGLSINYDRAQLAKQANGIYLKYDDPKYDDGQPVIKRVSL